MHINKFTIGIPIRQYRRTTKVLQHRRSEPIDFDYTKQDHHFYIITFDTDYDNFKNIVLLLKKNGITTIGADEQLTEKNIMKLTKLINEQSQYSIESDTGPSQGFSKGEAISTADDIIDRLKYT